MSAGIEIASHADRMDAVYRGQRHIYDLTRKYYLLGRDRQIARLRPAEGDRVLEIGCGTGRNLIVAALRYPQARFFGIDISEEMLISARKSVARAGLSDRITLARGDATAFDTGALFGERAFERVMFSYTLSMIPDWRSAIDQGLEALGRDGAVHIIDFGQQERLPRAFRAMLFSWLTRFHVTPRRGLSDHLQSLVSSKDLTLAFDPLYRGYAWSAELRRG